MPYVSTAPRRDAPKLNTRSLRIEHRSPKVVVRSNPSKQLALRERISSTDAKNSRCAGETRVTTPTFRMAIAR